jgi:hypothetical protein
MSEQSTDRPKADEASTPRQQDKREQDKKAYRVPRLIEYGRAVDLTGGGTGSKQETGQPKLDKFP